MLNHRCYPVGRQAVTRRDPCCCFFCSWGKRLTTRRKWRTIDSRELPGRDHRRLCPSCRLTVPYTVASDIGSGDSTMSHPKRSVDRRIRSSIPRAKHFLHNGNRQATKQPLGSDRSRRKERVLVLRRQCRGCRGGKQQREEDGDESDHRVESPEIPSCSPP
jgi:hypothetical protein